MKFLDQIISRARTATAMARKSSATIPFDPSLPNPLGSYYGTAQGVYDNRPISTDWSGEVAYQDGMRKSHWVFRCVRFLGDTLSSVPLGAQVRQSDGRWVYAENHPLHLLLKKPNFRHDSKFFVENVVHNLNLGGNALWEKIRSKDRARTVINLWPVHQDALKPVPDTSQFIRYYEYLNKTNRVYSKNPYVPCEDMIHIMFQNPMNPYWGISPLESVGRVVDTEVQAMKWWKMSLARMAVKDGIMSLKDPLPLDQWQEYRNMIEAEIVGARNSHGVILIGEEVDYTPISSSAKELDWIDSRKLSREDIAAAFGVPPMLVNILDRATYCMPSDTLVSTATGPKNIDKVSVGDEVWSWDTDKDKLVLKPVAWSGQTGNEAVYTVKTPTREFRCTGSHPVLVAKNRKSDVFKNYAWVQAKDLELGNVLVSANHADESLSPLEGCSTPSPPQGCTFSCVTSITKGEVIVPVYDISVPGTNNFVANGVVVHNSNFEQAQTHYWSNVAVPFLELLRTNLNTSLVPEFGDPDKLRVWFDLDKVPALRYDLDKKVGIMKNLFYMGTPLSTAADVVGLEMPRFEGDDVSYIASNLLPADAFDSEMRSFGNAVQSEPVKPEGGADKALREFKSKLLQGLPPI